MGRWAARAGAGALILTAARAEPDGDDPRAPATRAEPSAGGWRLRGTKTAVPAGEAAGLFLVPAATEDGTAVFCVERADPGVNAEPQRLTDGAGSARLDLAGAEVEDERLLGQPGPEGADWLAARAAVRLWPAPLG